MPLSAVWAAANERGISKENLYLIVQRETSQNSLKGLEEYQYRNIIKAMGPSPKGAMNLEGKYLNKVRALWIAAHNMGLVRSGHDKAMCAFIKRMTGLDHASWLVTDSDARKVIEALKSWISRETGLDWDSKEAEKDDDYRNSPQHKVAYWIFCKLVETGNWKLYAEAFQWGDYLGYSNKITGKGDPCFNTTNDWFAVQNALGKRLRGALAARARAAKKAKEAGNA